MYFIKYIIRNKYTKIYKKNIIFENEHGKILIVKYFIQTNAKL